jgi:hypothetical protein
MIKIIKEKGIVGRQAAHAWVRKHNIYDRAYYVYNKTVHAVTKTIDNVIVIEVGVAGQWATATKTVGEVLGCNQ